MIALTIWTFTSQWAHGSETAWGTYSLTPVGSTRVLGMGGAFTGLADDASAVFVNPAGLSISRYWVDLEGTTNRVVNREYDSDNDEVKDGLPFTSTFISAAARVGSFGLGVGYRKPFEVSDDFGGNAESKSEIGIENFAASVSLGIKKYFAVGVTGVQEKARVRYTDLSSGIDVEDKSESVYPIIGMLLHYDRKLSAGISYTPERKHVIDESLNSQAELSTTTWFRDLVIPQKLSFGLSLLGKRKVLWTGDVDVYSPVSNAVAVGRFANNEGEIINKQQVLVHGGFEWPVLKEKNLELLWRGGGYQEPKRVTAGESRFHFTMGLEFRLGFVVLAASYDHASDYSNVAQSASISINAL